MPVTASNLIQGPAVIYSAPFATAEPATLAISPSTGWTDVGGTKDGIEIEDSSEWSQLTVDQILLDIGSRRTGRSLVAKTNLAEATLANLARATANSAPVANVYTPDEGVAAFQPVYSALIIDGTAPGGFLRRITLRRVLATDSVGYAYKKDEQTVLPVSWKIHYVSASIPAFKIEDAIA